MACMSCEAKKNVKWQRQSDEANERGDRDDRTMMYASAKGSGRERLVPSATGNNRAWGGALRRVVVGGVTPSREDEHRLVSVPGRYVPVGFARYVSPVLDPNDYEYYRVAGWRVAVPRSIPGMRVRDLLYRIYNFGPQPAGYVARGDTLVPATLETGERATLSEAAVDFEPWPLSP